MTEARDESRMDGDGGTLPVIEELEDMTGQY